MAQIISGKEVALKVREDIKKEVSELYEKTGKRPGLAVIIVGEDPASQVYVRNKAKGCEEVGFHSEVYRLPEQTEMSELLALIDKLNKDESIHGILCQLPLPKHLDETAVILAIDPNKDVDAFHPVNTGKIMIGNYSFLPCTPAGVMELIASTGVDIAGKECVVVGRSNIVGKPQAMLLLQKNGTVTICHSRTKDLAEVTKRADILVVAVGRANFITGDMVKEGAIVVDVGINRGEDGKLVGDVHFDSIKDKASYITPVPGGVGPMTITCLMENTIECFLKQKTS
jgi:methylenetetrahydrofolate dehydrogenase (NADP+)/methenyltetrahydrofolate cyclohydrolase